ncbi:MAG: hypothetical protein IKT87_04055 [Bacteroidaceae bacterium]|nr:hypothetical protein [Bacteroidaceae bacterium]
MKKTYITPAVAAVNLDAATLMAVSLQVNNGTSVDTSVGGVQLGRDDQPSSPSVWEQGW